MFEVIPGILEKEWAEIEKKIERVALYVKTIHIDIIDGKFANNITFLDPAPFKKYTDEIFFELHMMVEEPINYLEAWAEVGFKRFLGHVEKMSSQVDFVAKAQTLGEVGLAVDGPTPTEVITVSLYDIDAVLIYTSEQAGFSGPPFVADRLDKVRLVRSKSEVLIGVDGGINDQTVIQAKNAGATRFVSTSFLFESGDIESTIDKLKGAINE